MDRSIILSGQLQEVILGDAGMSYVPMQAKKYSHFFSDIPWSGDYNIYPIPTTGFTWPNTSRVSIMHSHTPSPCAFLRYRFGNKDDMRCAEGTLPIYDERKIGDILCDVNASRAAIALSYLSDDDHTIGIIRGAGEHNAKKNYNVLAHQPGTVTSLALHTINSDVGASVQRLAYTMWKGNSLCKYFSFESQTLGRMRLFNIDKDGIYLAASAPTPCIFKELFPLNNKGSAYLGLGSEDGSVWTIHVNENNTISYSRKKTAEPISHIAVNTEHATPSGFYPLVLLLMGNRLMGADLALKPKTTLIHMDTIPDLGNVIRLVFDNKRYGVIYRKRLVDNLQELFYAGVGTRHPNHHLHPFLEGTTSMGAIYFQQQMDGIRAVKGAE
jgi:hypothetical protein